MQMTKVRQEYANGEAKLEGVYAGPVRFTCEGLPDDLMAEHSIWEPKEVFPRLIPKGGRIVIEVSE